MRVHFIAIGGSAMHNMAIALHKKGFKVTGSDDEIFDPAKTNLARFGLLPEIVGWNPEKITSDIDAVILGMHAMGDNPELARAKELGIKIFSYPEYIYEQSKNKTRVVIGGSHGKTTITSMVMHVLAFNKVDFDYMVGAHIEGFDTMVKLTENAKFCIIEGDEYLSSPDDRRPKFHLYKPNVALISGIAWDHINVFPTFEIYCEQFRIFADLIEQNGALIWFSDDQNIKNVADALRKDIESIPYNAHESYTTNGTTFLRTISGEVPLCVFGNHNLQNISGAKAICEKIGLTDEQFYSAIKEFKGAAKRLQLLGKNESTNIYLDFAHSPSKLMATTNAVKEQFPERKLVACMELHTFSSLKEDFLPQYNGTMKCADEAIVYFNPETIKHKRLSEITREQVAQAFGGENVVVYTDSAELVKALEKMDLEGKNLLLMSSGNFSGINFREFAEKLLSR